MPLSPTRLSSPYGSDRLVRLAASLRPALCDTLITVGSQEFPAHSLVLAGASQHLGRRGRWALVKGISPSTFAQLLYFVYGESVELQPGELGPLEEAARTLGVQSLEEACRRARRDRAREELGPGLKEQQEEPEKLTRGSERGVGGLGEKQRPEKFIRAGGTEQETLHEHRPTRENPEMAEATSESQGEQMRLKEKLNQFPVGRGGVDGKQEVIDQEMCQTLVAVATKVAPKPCPLHSGWSRGLWGCGTRPNLQGKGPSHGRSPGLHPRPRRAPGHICVPEA